jgi:pilus assembly protein CpaF
MSDIFNKISVSQGENNDSSLETDKKNVREEIQKKLPAFTNYQNLFGVVDPNQLATIKEHMLKIVSLTDTKLKPYEITRLIDSLTLEITSLGKLSPLVEDITISEIMINGPKDIWIERKGQLMKTDIEYDSDSDLMEMAVRIARNIGRNIDTSHPEVDARLPDGSRVHIIIPPVARKGVTITIRKFFKEKLTIKDLVDKNTITPEMARFLKALVYAKANTVISGGTGSGKTTTLNIVSNFIPEGERIITIEDSAELQLNIAHLVSLETKNANAEGYGEVNIERLVKASLRMRPDRIIVGEVRDHTAYDLLNAMNTGHEGSMSTVHSNDPESCITRLGNLIKQSGLGHSDETVRSLIGQSVDAIIQISRMRDGTRRITHISLIDIDEKGEVVISDIFRYKNHKNEKGEMEFGFIRTNQKLTARMIEKFEESSIDPLRFNPSEIE